MAQFWIVKKDPSGKKSLEQRVAGPFASEQEAYSAMHQFTDPVAHARRLRELQQSLRGVELIEAIKRETDQVTGFRVVKG